MIDDFAKRILRDVNLEEISPRQKRSADEDGQAADHWSPAVLLERAAYLRKLARYGNGSASEVIKEYPHYSVALSFIGRSGDAEVHHAYSCMFQILAGAATLVTGGNVVRSRSAGTGEIVGSSIEGGTTQELRQGEVAHVPAGVAHQFLIAGEKSITCLVVKIRAEK
jgi:mannose-6-phosphate isomerase-like protein (cupin superfamily)